MTQKNYFTKVFFTLGKINCRCRLLPTRRKDDVKEEAKRGLKAQQTVISLSRDDPDLSKHQFPSFPDIVTFVAQKVGDS